MAPQANEIYAKTFSGYKKLIEKGEYLSLRKYCKLHHVNVRGLSYWMKKLSIEHPGTKFREARQNSGHFQPKQSARVQVVPLSIQVAPEEVTNQQLTEGKDAILKDISISIQSGMIISIPGISCIDLAELILICNQARD
jgi:hypothetical protein